MEQDDRTVVAGVDSEQEIGSFALIADGRLWFRTARKGIEQSAVQFVWVGGDAADPNDWHNPGNWQGGQVPPRVDFSIEELADQWAFLVKNLGMKFP